MANKEVRIRVPEHMHDEVKKAGYKYLYMNDENYKFIMGIIKENPNTPLGHLQSQLRRQGITPSKEKMRHIATICDLPFTE